MAFRGIPFDSKMVSDSSGTYEDRQVFSEDFARYLGFVSSDGICLKDDEELTSQLLVEAGTDSEVILNPGTVKIQGRMGWITEPEFLFANPGGALPRIDSAVIELNLSTSVRGFVFKIVEGEESSNPEPPILVRTPDVWQLGLGNFYRPENSTSLGEFTDTRLDSERCGVSKVATPNIGADTLTLWQQSYPDITNLNDILHLIGSEGLPEEFGGTHSKSLPGARQKINFIGINSIASTADDTTTNWAALGTGYVWVDAGKLLNQPARGFVENVCRTTATGNHLIVQKLHTHASEGSSIYRREGDLNKGWYSDWTLLLDETNGIQMVKLWENASPTSEFPGQTVSLELSKYDEFAADFINNLDKDGDPVVRTVRGFCKRDEYTFVSALSMDGFTMRFRKFSAITANNGFIFSDGSYHNTGALNGANNKNLVPIRIYGIKGVK